MPVLLAFGAAVGVAAIICTLWKRGKFLYQKPIFDTHTNADIEPEKGKYAMIPEYYSQTL